MKLLITFVSLLVLGSGYCSAAVYTSKEDPQYAVQYFETPSGALTVGQCQEYSRKNSPNQIWRCRSTFATHFYWNGEIVDARMDEIAKTAWLHMREQQKQSKSMEQGAGVFIGPLLFILMWIGIGMVYLLPTIIAFRKDHKQKWSIAAMNIVLGGTGLAWVGALIWSFQGIGKTQKPDGKSNVCSQCNERNNLKFTQCWKCGAPLGSSMDPRVNPEAYLQGPEDKEFLAAMKNVGDDTNTVLTYEEAVAWLVGKARTSDRLASVASIYAFAEEGFDKFDKFFPDNPSRDDEDMPDLYADFSQREDASKAWKWTEVVKGAFLAFGDKANAKKMDDAIAAGSGHK